MDALAQPAVALELGADERVEALAALVVTHDQHRLPPRACGLALAPRGDRCVLAGACALRVAGVDVQLAAGGLLGDVVGGVAAADLGQQLALARIALAHHLAQLVRAQPLGERSQPAAGLDARELTGVADRDDLHPGGVGVRHDPGGLAGARHPRLVEDQHRPTRPEAAVVGVEVERQARQRPRLADAGLLGELAHRASRRRGPQDAIAAGRVGLGEQAGGERLARPRQRLDRLHPVTARGQATDDMGLLGRRRVRRAGQHRVDERASRACPCLRHDAPARRARSRARGRADRSS